MRRSAWLKSSVRPGPSLPTAALPASGLRGRPISRTSQPVAPPLYSYQNRTRASEVNAATNCRPRATTCRRASSALRRSERAATLGLPGGTNPRTSPPLSRWYGKWPAILPSRFSRRSRRCKRRRRLSHRTCPRPLLCRSTSSCPLPPRRPCSR